MKLNQDVILNNLPETVSETSTVKIITDVYILNDKGIVKVGYCLFKNRRFDIELDPRTNVWVGQ